MKNKFSENPLVSVVVPVYCHTADHEQFLKEALRSIAGQSYRNFEVILVDDRSPVDIAPIVASITGLPHTTIIKNAVNMGHAESRNVGIRASEGELIAFLDHDDLWLPEKLADQVRCLADNPQAGLAFCDMEIFGAQANRLNINQSLIPEKPSFYWFVCHGNFTISASAVLVRKNVIQEIGFFDSRYSTCDDFDAWLKILMHHEIIHIPLELAKYRLHSYNVNYTVDRLNDNKLLTSLIMRYYRGASLLEKLKLIPRILRKFIGRVYFSLYRFRSFNS